MLRTMIRIRAFEERIQRLVTGGLLPREFQFRGGGEAVAVGVCSALRPTDRVFSTHDPHRHMLAKGLGLTKMLEEVFGTENSHTLGKGGWVNVTVPSMGMFPGSGTPLGAATGTGTAWGDLHLRRDHVTAVIVDSPVPTEILRECMDTGRSWSLPVFFVIDASRCERLGMPQPLAGDFGRGASREAVDGNDVTAVAEATRRAAERARAGGGPSIIDALAAGPCESSADPASGGACRHDPIAAHHDRRSSAGSPESPTAAEMAAEERSLVDDAIAAVRASSFPDPEEAVSEIYAVAPEVGLP